jgi:hypothetical protein
VISYVLPGPAANRMTAPEDAGRQAEEQIMEEEGELAGAGLMLAEEQLPLTGGVRPE